MLDAEAIIGIDLIKKLGGVFVNPTLEVQFGRKKFSAAIGKTCEEKQLVVSDHDFRAHFHGQKWTVEWKWNDGEPVITNKCAGYPVAPDVVDDFDHEIEQWIKDGWLKEYDPDVHGSQAGVIPLLAVKQPNKPRRVRPVMDYRELNYHVISHPGFDAAVCQEKLRKWRKRGTCAFLLDLKKAYLQVHVAESLQRFQMVKYKNKCYVMTRMGFGLNVAPKVMSKIVSHVLSLDNEISRGTDHYIDDIYVDAGIVEVSKVQQHLSDYGLVTKDPVSIDDARVLGLRVTANTGKPHRWGRDAALPVLSETLTKRELFSVCGKLTGHFPVAGWLRVACSYIKRLTNETAWDDHILPLPLILVREVMRKLQTDDPVQGVWHVSSTGRVEVWCDASSMAVACCLAVDGVIVEDAAWMRKIDDGAHINVAELEAVVKGLSLALRWDMRKVDVITDSASVYNWVRSMLEDTHRPRVSGLSEMIIRRRLGIIAQLIEEYGMEIGIRLVPSANNLADSLTRVPNKWLQEVRVAAGIAYNTEVEEIRKIHNRHCLGIERTLFVAKKSLGGSITPSRVKKSGRRVQHMPED